MDKFYSIGEAANYLGVSVSTLRRWEKEGKITSERTKGGQRRYPISVLEPNLKKSESQTKLTVAYARVSSHDQKSDLERQKQLLEMYCASKGWTFELLADLGSGMNYNKKGLKKLIQKILTGEIGRLVITHKDRLLRFGAELVFSICEMKNVEVVIVNQGDEPSFEEDLAKDVLEIITVFSARLYGSRSKKNKKLIENLKDVADAVSAPDRTETK
ncbi:MULTISPECIES: IS607 family transposase [Cysteiniphilum]|uniref:IS607 family transposase n=1 Tax=Cysteiniphilum TaxID=2056696 RepID=UPI001782AB81|nr:MULTISPECIES: IS607 family transposase [Cysteiniphilum]